MVPDLIVDEPLAPLATPVHLTAQRFGKVDKVYIHTAKDQVVSPYLQNAMVLTANVRQQTTFDTGHPHHYGRSWPGVGNRKGC